MRKLLKDLMEICNNYPLEEKVVIMPSHSAGQQLLQALALEGYKFLNLKINTLLSIATDKCKDYLYKNDLEILNSTLARHFMLNILQSLKASNSLKYFQELKFNPGICRVIYNAVLELKTTGFKPDNIQEDLFTNSDKGLDIKLIFDKYQQVLKENKYLDVVDVYTHAIQVCSKTKTNQIYIVPSNLKLNSLEKKFLHSLTNDAYYTICFNSPKGLVRPKAYVVKETPSFEDDIKTSIDRLKLLYDLDNYSSPLTDNTINLIQAYGDSNEVMEIVRRIKKEKIALDKCAVFYTSCEPYTQLFFNLSQKLDLPITFGEGVDIKNTKPGRLFFELIEWLGNNFEVKSLVAILTGGNFKIKEDNVPGNYRVASILRTVGIGWGRDRYVSQLAKEIAAVQEKVNDAIDDGKKDLYEKKLQELIWTKEFANKLINLFPEEDKDGNLSYGQFTKGLIAFIEDYSNVTGETDGEAKKVIIESLGVIADCAPEYLSIEEIILRWENIIGGLRVNRSSPKPGHLHIDSYRKGIWVSRSNNYIVGLDAGRFPGQYREDPIILDLERRSLSSDLELKENILKENLYDMVQLLASLKGRVTLSYSAFDIVENREVFPSSLLLQVFRLLTGDETKDYSQLIAYFGKKAGFIPQQLEDAIDPTDFWLNNEFLGGGIKSPEDTLVNYFVNLSNGLRSWKGRKSFNFTVYEGNVNVDCDLVDPRKNHQLVMSASRLEELAKCPYGYFLKYILQVKPLEEISYDPGIWLDAFSRGNLLHKIFEMFYKELKGNGEKPSLIKHEKRLYEIADELLVEKKKELPPPSEVIYDYEYREIMESCRVFLINEEQLCLGVTPCHFELEFDPVAITLPSEEKVYVKGRIDRVDQADDKGFIVLDYKTGKTYGFDESKPYQCGKQLQHTLYAVALEEYLKHNSKEKNPVVKAGGYVFPTLKGEGQIFLYSQENRKAFYNILELLCEILNNGIFVMTDADDDCKYCDYKEVCQKDFFKEAFIEMFNNSGNTQLELFRRLKEYE